MRQSEVTTTLARKERMQECANSANEKSEVKSNGNVTQEQYKDELISFRGVEEALSYRNICHRNDRGLHWTDLQFQT